MIKLSDPKRDASGVLVITDEELEDFAYRQLRDYRKGYFKTPHALDIDDFVENYLGIQVFYYGLSLDKTKLGATVLTDGILPVIDSNGEITPLMFKKGQIIIDCDACANVETRIRFSLGHESLHSQQDTCVDVSRIGDCDAISDTYNDIFKGPGKHRKWTPRDWMEHHANRYAVFLLMPKVFVTKLWKRYHDLFFRGKRITSNSPKRLWKVIHCIAEELSVAQSAIAFRLLELGVISKEMFDSLKINI